MYRLKIHLFSLVSIISLVSGALGLPARGALAAPGAAGAVPLDIVLVLDASESMTYDAGQADPMRDPSQCNPVGGCHPFEEARQAAKGFVDRLGFPDDRAALVTFDGGARVDLGFSSDKAQVQAALDALQVVTPEICPTASGPCRDYLRYADDDPVYGNNNGNPWDEPVIDEDGDGMGDTYIGLACPIYNQTGDPSSCTSTAIGQGLLEAGNEFSSPATYREGALRAVILLTDGAANAPDFVCPPSTWTSPFCRDTSATTRHCLEPDDASCLAAGGVYDPDRYDADDYARDMADSLAQDQGALLYTIGLGSLVQTSIPVDANGWGAGEQLLRYAADTGDGMYYFAPDGDALDAIFLDIFSQLSPGPACYTLALSSGGNGAPPSASPLKSADCASDGQYIEGESISLSAYPDPGYHVATWSGTDDDASRALTNTLSMPAGDRSVTVTYAQTQLSGLRCTQLTPLDTLANTAEKPQSKVWQHAGAWWTVLPAGTGTASSNGTFLWKLVGTTWTEARKLSNLTGAKADAKVDGDVAHILLENGSSTELVSIEYNAGTGTYNAWSLRPATSGIALPGNETATIDIDSTGRMWLATENGLNEIIVYHSASPYTAWEGPVVLASNVNSDDIAVVTAMPGNKVGVLWSDQNARRFGFRTHSDGDPAGAWSADEVPASQSALNVGLGMADDHLNVAVASDGTLYAAVKTSYDTAGYPKIALLVRRPDGAWDDLHEVDQDGTRPIVQLDETSDLLTVIYTSSEGYNDMVYRQSGTQGIAFGNLGTLTAANVTDASGAKQNHTGELLTIFHSSSQVLGTLCAPDLYTLTITSDHGTVTKNPDQPTYHLNDVVQLTATPEDGWSFAAWTGDRTGTDNPISVVITGDMAITATYTFTATSPVITLHPTDQTASAGQGVSFSAAASGDPAPTLQWQVSTDGGATFGDIPGATSDPLTFTAASTDRGNRYRAVFTNLAGSATSNAALLRVTPGAFGKSTPPDGATNLGTTVDLAWGPSSGASSYQYCIAASAAGCTSWVDRGVDTFATVSGLNPGTTYYWHVRAVNDDGTVYANGSESAVWSFTAADAPAVLSVLRADPDHTNAASVDFTVTFSEAVTGVDLGDFSLTTTGVISPSITGVSGSGTTYTVSVHTGFGDHNGTIRLNVLDNGTVVDGNGTPLAGGFNTGEIYTIVKHNADTTGVFRPGNGLLYLKNQNTTGFADIALNYGIPGDYPITGDWDGDGVDTIGVYRNGTFYLRNSNSIGFANIVFSFGQPGDQPIAGDWDGDGIDTVGVYRTSTGQFLLRNDNSAGAADVSFYLGNVGDVGIAGDWDGDGMDTTGVFRPGNGVIFLKNTNATGFADIALNYGIPGDQPVTGDWDGDGDDTIGVYRTGVFYLRNSNTVGFADIVFGLGNPGDMPIAGDWDGLP